ncbi:MAG TPA: branched-chain amino acid ABC transporter permease [bacterium]|nr:branched-chain amino acid ABC transporter permease [bacterium]
MSPAGDASEAIRTERVFAIIGAAPLCVPGTRANMEGAFQLLISGALTGAEYALAAVGMALIFRVGRGINLAHGAFVALGAYIAYQTSLSGLPALAGAGPAAAGGLLLGGAVERVLMRRVRGDLLAQAVVLLALAVLAEGGFLLVVGDSPHSVPLRLAPLLLGRIVINTEQAIAVVITAAILGAMALGIRTRPGLALRAVIANPEIAALSGIDVGRVRTITFAAACAMGAAAGAFLSPLFTISPTMGRGPLALTLAMILVGGVGRIRGILAASLGIGVASAVVGFYLAPAWSNVLGLLLVAAAIISRPLDAPGGRRR